jgi:hypothetical protein
VFKRRNKYSAVPQAFRRIWAEAKIEIYGEFIKGNELEEAGPGADFPVAWSSNYWIFSISLKHFH